MCFKIDWAGLIVERKFTFFALFYFLFYGNFPSTSPQGAYIWRVGLTDVFFFCITSLGGLYYFGRTYTWRGLFSEFYGVYFQPQLKTHLKQRCPFDKTDSITPIPIRRGLNSSTENLDFSFLSIRSFFHVYELAYSLW